jgi:hypothetical protein
MSGFTSTLSLRSDSNGNYHMKSVPNTLIISYFSPNTTGCIFWFDANDSACVYSGTTLAVTGLKDKSGVGNNATTIVGTGSAQIITNAINGHPVLYLNNKGFNGSITSYTGSVWSFYFVATMISNTNGAYGRMLSIGSTTGTDDANDNTKFAIYTITNTARVYLQRLSTGGEFPNMALNTPYLFSGYFDNTNLYLFLNGILVVTSPSTGAFSTTRFGLGASNGGSVIDKAYFGEMLLYQVALTASDRQKTEGYLAWKWGLQSKLSVGHPYKTVAP